MWRQHKVRQGTRRETETRPVPVLPFEIGISLNMVSHELHGGYHSLAKAIEPVIQWAQGCWQQTGTPKASMAQPEAVMMCTTRQKDRWRDCCGDPDFRWMSCRVYSSRTHSIVRVLDWLLVHGSTGVLTWISGCTSRNQDDPSWLVVACNRRARWLCVAAMESHGSLERFSPAREAG